MNAYSPFQKFPWSPEDLGNTAELLKLSVKIPRRSVISTRWIGVSGPAPDIPDMTASHLPNLIQELSTASFSAPALDLPSFAD